MQYEIMAPVGSRESLAAALRAGADSIYFGIESLNMRAHSASRFSINDLREIAALCEEHGVKSYLTVNTIIYGEDLDMMRTICDAAKAAQYVYVPEEVKTQGAKTEDIQKALIEVVKAEQAKMKAVDAKVTLGKVTYTNKEKTQATIKGTLKSKASDKPQDADIPLIKTKDGWKVVMP